MRKRKITRQVADSTDGSAANLTPLIDVVFVVLIMFIIIAPMLEIDKVKLATGPQTEFKEGATPSDLYLHVLEDNTILINKRPVSESALLSVLTALHTKNPNLTPQLFQDKRALFGTYQCVKNALEEAGYKELEVVLEPNK
jgi:biopolymer transport protein ExbD